MNELQVADQTGRTVLVTGATGGVGFFTSLELARAGARVIVTGRADERIAAALRGIRKLAPGAEVLGRRLDVTELASIPSVIDDIVDDVGGGLDTVIFNAGTTTPPLARTTTADGHETVFATNALGHFVIGARVLPALARAGRERGSHSRMVWLGSLVTTAPWDPVDLELQHGYSAPRAYTQSKIVMQAIGFEAAGRLAVAGVPVDSIVAHPGYALSGRDRRVPGINEPSKLERFAHELQAAFTQSKERGAQPIVHAASDPEVRTGEFWGPSGVVKGRPRRATPASMTMDAGIRGRIWRDCVEIAGVDWPIAEVSAGSGSAS